MSSPDAGSPDRSIYRHALPTRLGHWLAALCLLVLIMSGLQIFNAHPALYWGDRSDPGHALFRLRALETPDGKTRGVTEILGHPIPTTGVLGASREAGPDLEARGFPSWATLPGEQWLAMGRRWHFFFAWIFVLNGLAFALWALLRGHAARDLWPTGQDVRGKRLELMGDSQSTREIVGVVGNISHTALSDPQSSPTDLHAGVISGSARHDLMVHLTRAPRAPLRCATLWWVGNVLLLLLCFW